MRMMDQCADVDNKYWAIRDAAGHIIYSDFDEIVQNRIQSSENTGNLSLDGAKNDKHRVNSTSRN